MDNIKWTFDEEKREWIDQDGIRYSEDKKVLNHCPHDYKEIFCIPAFVTSIGDYAFEDCSYLKTIIIPNSVKSIGAGAFSGCSNLGEIINYEPNTKKGSEINSFLRKGTKVFLSYPTSMEFFIHDTPLAEFINHGKISIPKSVNIIEDNTFWNCTNIREVIISESVTSIGNGAFAKCSYLKEITIPESVKSIGENAFRGCYNLRKIEIPRSLERIGENAFCGCPIKSVNLPPNTDYKFNSFDEVTKVVRAKVAISYSWDSEEHKAWVRKLAEDLQKNGVYVILDQWELKVGQLIPEFMEQSIKEAERVICIMTPDYKKKSEKSNGGVAYENCIIKSEVFENSKTIKFIPVLRKGTYKESAPTTLYQRYTVNMTDDSKYVENLIELLRVIFDMPTYSNHILSTPSKFDLTQASQLITLLGYKG